MALGTEDNDKKVIEQKKNGDTPATKSISTNNNEIPKKKGEISYNL